MSKLFKYKVLNFILFAVVLSTAFMNYETWSHSNGSAKGVAQRPEVRVENQNKTAALAAKEEPESAQSFRMIAEKNIFNPERKDFPSAGLNPVEQPKPVIRPQVILSGVVIFDDYQAASVSSPGRPLRKGEREAMTLKLGDKIGEYKLAKIADDRITLEAAGDSFQVLLHDGKKPKTRVEVKTAIQPISEARTTQSAPATPPTTEITKAEALKRSAEPTQGKIIASGSPWQRSDVPPSEVRWRKATRSLMGSNQPNAGTVGSKSGSGKTKPE